MTELDFVPVELDANQTTQYELKIEASNKDDRMTVSFIYSKALYDEATVALLVKYYQAILASILRDAHIHIGHIALESSYEYLVEN